MTNLVNRAVAIYLEKYMIDHTLFKLFEMPERSNLSTLREALIRIEEIEKSQVPLNNNADSFSDLILMIDSESVTIKQKYMKMCLYSAFRECKYRSIDDILKITDRVVKDLKLMVSFLHPFRSYVDLLTNRLLAMSVDSVVPGPDNYLKEEEIREFSERINNHLPKFIAAVKLAIDIKSSHQIKDSYMGPMP